VSGGWEGLTPPYSTIVADPPWPYDDKPFTWRQEVGVDAFLPYSTMSVDDIARMPVIDIAAPGAHLYLWTTNRYLWDARDIALGWGFAPAQVLVWCKAPNGIPVGTFNSNSTEFVIFARRTVTQKREVVRAGALIREAREAAGLNRADLHRAVRGGTPTGIVFRWEDDDSLPNADDWARMQEVLPALRGVERPYVEPPPERENVRAGTAWFQWPRTHHSAKPDAFGDLVEQVSPGPYVELFCRRPRLGWDHWGHGYEMSA
jgi:N6-adenosine-specific RNA methylase IME4